MWIVIRALLGIGLDKRLSAFFELISKEATESKALRQGDK
jgi:hypothetical protein